MNYQKELDTLAAALPHHNNTLLLHSCCAPCSSYVLEYVRQYFAVTLFYYNPNITEEKEYQKRVAEQKRLLALLNQTRQNGEQEIHFLEGAYEPEHFLLEVKGLEHCKEGGERCERCFRLRLTETARVAVKHSFMYFTTTLSVSPLKNAELLNTIGRQTADRTGIAFLPSDFKKKNGYKRSVELSGQYGLYRQDYCGCIYSKRQREQEKQERAEYEENN